MIEETNEELKTKEKKHLDKLYKSRNTLSKVRSLWGLITLAAFGVGVFNILTDARSLIIEFFWIIPGIVYLIIHIKMLKNKKELLTINEKISLESDVPHVVIQAIIAFLVLLMIAFNIFLFAAKFPYVYRFVDEDNRVLKNNYYDCEGIASTIAYAPQEAREIYKGSLAEYLETHPEMLKEFYRSYFYREDEKPGPAEIDKYFTHQVIGIHHEIVITDKDVEVYIPELIDCNGQRVSCKKNIW